MKEMQPEFFEKQVRSLAQGLEYPRTPDIAGSVAARLRGGQWRRVRGEGGRWAWALMVLLILFASLMLIPPARAAILEFIQIGVVRIFRAEPTPLPPSNQESPTTVVPTSQPLIPILEQLAGETTLEEAQKEVSYPILLPTYPADLGRPDRVFVQEAEGKMTILVWINPGRPDKIAMSLHLIPPTSWAIDKFDPAEVQETQVDGQRAIWAVGPYPLRLRNNDLEFTRLIAGHVLIWKDDEITYRLETDQSLEEAIQIAESLQPFKP
jgi:hypothetical protein